MYREVLPCSIPFVADACRGVGQKHQYQVLVLIFPSKSSSNGNIPMYKSKPDTPIGQMMPNRPIKIIFASQNAEKISPLTHTSSQKGVDRK
jgi:hypothetical protein